jgi:hypothetical protein
MRWLALKMVRKEKGASIHRGLKLRHGLDLPNHPAIRTRSHEHNEVHDDMLVMDESSAIGNLQVILGGIAQLHDIALRCVERRFEAMILI